jgi:hypothetical protein
VQISAVKNMIVFGPTVTEARPWLSVVAALFVATQKCAAANSNAAPLTKAQVARMVMQNRSPLAYRWMKNENKWGKTDPVLCHWFRGRRYLKRGDNEAC